GKMMPFQTIGFYNPSSGTLSPTYQPNAIPFYIKDIKYPKGNTSEPLSLVYASKSFESNDPGLFFGVLVYKVNHDFKATNVNGTSSSSSSSNATTLASNLTNVNGTSSSSSSSNATTLASNLTNGTSN